MLSTTTGLRSSPIRRWLAWPALHPQLQGAAVIGGPVSSR